MTLRFSMNTTLIAMERMMPKQSRPLFPRRDKGRIAAEVCHAPQTGYDPNKPGMYPRLDWETRTALERCVRGMPWSDPVLLTAIILAAHGWQAWQILEALRLLHGNLLAIFYAEGLTEIEEWDVDRQCDNDLKNVRWNERARAGRVIFWSQYQDISFELLRWFEQLPDADQRTYRPFLLPILSRGKPIKTQASE